MGNSREVNQFSIAGLLFVTVGVAFCCAAIPYLDKVSPMSPPWSVFAAIILTFGWAMTALRKGSARAWWLGFVVSGALYVSIVAFPVARLVSGSCGIVREIESVREVLDTALSLGELPIVFGILVVSLTLFLGCGMLGGWIAKRLYERYQNRQPCKPNSGPSNRSALP